MGDHVRLDPEANPETLVSVLVPSYNHEKYVVECLESIKNLKYRRLELIVSDDCSSDSTFVLVERWTQRNADRFERTIVVRQDMNLGIVRNLQFLFNSAQGDYLTYIASDDAFVESAIASRVKLLQDNPDIDAVFGNAQLISDSGSVLKEEYISRRVARELSLNGLLISSFILNWCVPGPVMMIRREAVLEGGSLGLLPTDLWAEDWYIYFRLAIRGRLRYINEVVAKWRVVHNSMSQLTTHTKVRIELLVQLDSMNRCFLTGFNRILIETRIARFRLQLYKGNIVVDLIRKIFWRYVVSLQRLLLFIYAIILSARHVPDLGNSNQ